MPTASHSSFFLRAYPAAVDKLLKILQIGFGSLKLLFQFAADGRHHPLVPLVHLINLRETDGNELGGIFPSLFAHLQRSDHLFGFFHRPSLRHGERALHSRISHARNPQMGRVTSAFFLKRLFAVSTLQPAHTHRRRRTGRLQLLPDGFTSVSGFASIGGNAEIARPYIGVVEEERAFAILKLAPVGRIDDSEPSSGRDKFLAFHHLFCSIWILYLSTLKFLLIRSSTAAFTSNRAVRKQVKVSATPPPLPLFTSNRAVRKQAKAFYERFRQCWFHRNRAVRKRVRAFCHRFRHCRFRPQPSCSKAGEGFLSSAPSLPLFTTAYSAIATVSFPGHFPMGCIFLRTSFDISRNI